MMIQEKSDLHRNVEKLIGACFYYSGLVALARLRQRHSKKSLIILNYHHASGGDLRKHMLYLRRHYRLLHLEEALEELYSSQKQKIEGKKPRPALVLTFDDGYYDNYTHAVPLAEELQVPITIFLVPGYIESGCPFWWSEGEHLLSQTRQKQVTLNSCTYRLDNANERRSLLTFINRCVWYATTVREREAFLEHMHDLLAVSPGIDRNRGSLPMGWEEIRAISNYRWISFGAHTVHHPVLGYMSDPVEILHEVRESRTILEQQLDLPIHTFAYPIGRFEHIGEHGYMAAQQSGYHWCVTTQSGFNTSLTDPHLLHRICIDVRDHWLMMATRTSGVEHFCSRLFWTSINFVRRRFGLRRIVR